MLPKINKIYHHFDDGKIRGSRLYTTRVLEIIPFDKAPKNVIDLWNKEKYFSIYLDEQDYFLKAKLKDIEEPIYYVKSKRIGHKTSDDIYWFSLGF